MALRMMPLLLAFLVLTHQAGAQLTISVTTFPPPKGDGTPNTFIGTGSQFAASLLGSSTPALMWGVVPSSDVNAVCTQIVNTGTLSFSATLTASSGATETLQQTVSAWAHGPKLIAERLKNLARKVRHELLRLEFTLAV